MCEAERLPELAVVPLVTDDLLDGAEHHPTHNQEPFRIVPDFTISVSSSSCNYLFLIHFLFSFLSLSILLCSLPALRMTLTRKRKHRDQNEAENICLHELPAYYTTILTAGTILNLRVIQYILH